MSDDKFKADAETAPESYYTQAPAYNPGAPEYANHQGYATSASASASAQTPPQSHYAPSEHASTHSVPPAAASASSSADAHASSSSTAPTSTARRFGFADKLSALGARAASPINQLANKLGSEGFLPDTMDKECEKAARVLKGFCKHGIYADTAPATPPATESGEPALLSGPVASKKPARTLVTIPAKVIQKAVGLAIFTTGRFGIHVSGATGSGVLIARLPDGSWSPPSGIQIHSVGAGFILGADIYDCVLVLNSQKALDAFLSTRLSLGSDVSLVAGPYGAGGSVDIGAAAERRKGKQPMVEPESASTPEATTDPSQPPSYDLPPTKTAKQSALRSTINMASYSYIKSRGIYVGVKVDGSVVNERRSANTAFYGSAVPVASILRGEIPRTGNAAWQPSVQALLDTVRAAEALGVPAPGAAPSAASPLNQNPYQNQNQYQQPETWANAAPATVFHPDSSAYPQAPPSTIAGDHPVTEADVHSTYVKDEPFATRANTDGVSTAASTPTAGNASIVSPVYSKAQEAAAESAAARAAAAEEAAGGPPPPEYTEGDSVAGDSASHSDLPPAYDHSEHAPAGAGDSKTGRH